MEKNEINLSEIRSFKDLKAAKQQQDSNNQMVDLVNLDFRLQKKYLLLNSILINLGK